MRRLGTAVLLLALCAMPQDLLWAQKVGTSSLQFLKVMPTARATALGDAYVTLAAGANAVFWNPAGLAAASVNDIAMTMTVWLFDTKQGALAYVVKPVTDASFQSARRKLVETFPELGEAHSP